MSIVIDGTNYTKIYLLVVYSKNAPFRIKRTMFFGTKYDCDKAGKYWHYNGHCCGYTFALIPTVVYEDFFYGVY